MRRPTWFTVTALACFLIHSQANANTVTLTVKEVTGTVMVETGGHVQRASLGMTFTPPAEVRVGADGSMLLADSETTLKISANSVIAIPASAQPSGMIDRILQRSGSVLYNVNSRKGRPFAVETALLTSVVKGTLFSVNVQDQSAAVALLEGSLEVSGLDIEYPVLLAPGDAAHRERGERSVLVDRHRTAASVPSQPRAIRGAAMPAEMVETRGVARATEDLAQLTAAIGLAPPSSVPVPVGGTPPSTPAPSPSPPSTSPPPVSPPVTPPVTPPPVTPSVTPPPVTPPPVTPPPVIPPPVTPPVMTPPPPGVPPLLPSDDEDQKAGKGSRHGRARGHEQDHGQGNDDPG